MMPAFPPPRFTLTAKFIFIRLFLLWITISLVFWEFNEGLLCLPHTATQIMGIYVMSVEMHTEASRGKKLTNLGISKSVKSRGERWGG